MKKLFVFFLMVAVNATHGMDLPADREKPAAHNPRKRKRKPAGTERTVKCFEPGCPKIIRSGLSLHALQSTLLVHHFRHDKKLAELMKRQCDQDAYMDENGMWEMRCPLDACPARIRSSNPSYLLGAWQSHVATKKVHNAVGLTIIKNYVHENHVATPCEK